MRVYRTITWFPGTQWLEKTPADILLCGVMWMSVGKEGAGSSGCMEGSSPSRAAQVSDFETWNT